MQYTKDLIVKLQRQTDTGIIEDSLSVQKMFTCCLFWIKENTSESNNSLRNMLQTVPLLASLKDSNQNGTTLLIYAAHIGNLEAAQSILKFTDDINAAEDSMQQTALHAATVNNHLSIVDLLIQKGAHVNLQDKNKNTALFMASANGNPEIVQRIANVPGAELETVNSENLSPLQIAAYNGHAPVVECLVKKKINVNRQDPHKKTALHYATKHPNVVKILLNNGANPNLKDAVDHTPLYQATGYGEIESVRYMMENGADPYIKKLEVDTAFDVALDQKDMDLLTALWNKDSTKNLYQSIVNNDAEKANRLLSEHQYTEEELRACFISSINHHKYGSASTLLEHEQGLPSKYGRARSPEHDVTIDKQNGVTKETVRKVIYDFHKDLHKQQFVFKGTSFENKSESILDAFAQMSELLYDIPECIELLKPVDDELKELLPQLKDIQPQGNIVIKELNWPAAVPENYQHIDKKGALRKILRAHLQKHGIERQNELYNFSGFVETKTANEVIKKGALFKEQFLLGNALTHGLYSHYFQWFLMAQAIKTGRVKLQDGLSLKEILQASVAIQSKDGSTAWAKIIDNVSTHLYALNHDPMRLASRNYTFFSSSPSRYRLSSIMDLSSFLYTSSELSYIRGYLLDSLYKNIQKMQRLMKEKFPGDEPIKSQHIIAGQAASFWVFGRINLGLTNKDVDNYYKNHAKTPGQLDLETGVVRKSMTSLKS